MSYTEEEIEKLRDNARVLRLKGYEHLFSYSLRKLTDICNGVGANWMYKPLRQLVTRLAWYLESSATIHDLRYELKFDKDLADKEFLDNGKLEISNNFSWYNPMKVYALGKLKFYYYLCKKAGEKAYKES